MERHTIVLCGSLWWTQLSSQGKNAVTFKATAIRTYNTLKGREGIIVLGVDVKFCVC